MKPTAAGTLNAAACAPFCPTAVWLPGRGHQCVRTGCCRWRGLLAAELLALGAEVRAPSEWGVTVGAPENHKARTRPGPSLLRPRSRPNIITASSDHRSLPESCTRAATAQSCWWRVSPCSRWTPHLPPRHLLVPAASPSRCTSAASAIECFLPRLLGSATSTPSTRKAEF